MALTLKLRKKRKINGGRYSKAEPSKRTYKGVVYQSIWEMQYAQKLDFMLKAGEIKSWERQVPFPIIINDQKVTTYICDFKVNYHDGSVKYIDPKSSPKIVDEVFKLKAKLVKALYGVEIEVVYQKP